jgi:pilus assembly protein Flp/PilA
MKRVRSQFTEAMYGLFPQREEGQGMVEYGLILALVAVVAVAALVLMGPKVKSILGSVNASL